MFTRVTVDFSIKMINTYIREYQTRTYLRIIKVLCSLENASYRDTGVFLKRLSF